MRETAEAIGISLTAAKGRLFHAKNALRRSLIPKLVHQPRFATGFAFCPHGNGSRRAKGRMRFNEQQQTNHKEEGDEYVIENKEERKYRVPSNLHHDGGDARCFGEELGA
jgi:hypothetical protein